MKEFSILFGIVFVFITLFLGSLAFINGRRKTKSGCSGEHDCVVYKGERVTCPACDLKEYNAQKELKKRTSNPKRDIYRKHQK
jgi:hypothetical protein